MGERPETTFLPALIDHVLELLPRVIRKPSVKSEPGVPGKNGATEGVQNGGADEHDDDEDDGEDDDEAVGAAPATGGFFEDPNEPLRMEDLPADGHEGGDDAGTAAAPAPAPARRMVAQTSGRADAALHRKAASSRPHDVRSAAAAQHT